MPTLALAGGTSPSLGRAIVAAVISQTQWNVLILSRSTKAPVWLRAIDPDAKRHTIAAVDYASVDSLTESLKAQTAHTLVSVTSAVDGTQAQTQVNLLHAAVKAGCKRFAPAQWGFGPKGYYNVPSLQWANQGIREECQKHRGQIEYAYFNQGSFMNYIGIGIFAAPGPADNGDQSLAQFRAGEGYKPGEDAAVEGVQRQGPLADKSGAYLLGMKNGIAELPIKEDGTWPRISFTSARDVGRFVAASLDLPQWEEEMGMAGDTVTMGELLESAEAVTGKKFKVTALKKQVLEERLAKIPEYEFMDRLWVEFSLAYIRDMEDEVVLDPVVNLLCPAVKPTTVSEYMEKHWAASQ
ncbi:Oxidoreductase BOA1 like protein [Verticillium longisporum]|uniref:Oxidoreductase BOA1 like protein n=1 Tax=Verticillium longisporum TaxID=100787 RepID=A0A8I2Z8X6_VERLO|nr:Oxidoreductase BOA1 like protein [Verticillium longisporum]